MTHICVGNLNVIGSDNGLSPDRCQAIIWTNAGILLIWTLGNKLQWNINRILYIFIRENVFENVVLVMVAILSRSQCVKEHVAWYIVGATIMALCRVVKWMQLLWRSGIRRWNLQVSAFQRSNGRPFGRPYRMYVDQVTHVDMIHSWTRRFAYIKHLYAVLRNRITHPLSRR